jgi:Endo-beta-mannanase
MKKLALFLFVFSCVVACNNKDVKKQEESFIKVENGKFIKNGSPYYFIGTNFWYGPILGSTGVGGDRDRLHRELDTLKALGMENLRVLIGSDGDHNVFAKVEPTLQKTPGVYNDTLLDGLDYFMNELSKRDMTAVLYFNNSWEWSGGYTQYLMWAGYPDAPKPALDGYETYVDYASQFIRCDSAKQMHMNYIKDIVTRVNRYNGKKYTEDPTIFSWQICNEPRPFADSNKVLFAEWMENSAALIKSLDTNHMVSSGSEGKYGCHVDMELFEKIHASKNFDYLNIHVWPHNWGWTDKKNVEGTVDNAIEKSKEYIDEHLIIAKKLGKPIVMEEFGYPRDKASFSCDVAVSARDKFYKSMFEYVVNDAKNGGLMAGCNIWGWGGEAKYNLALRDYWKPGDDYCCDPAQEPQGLYSVFATDSTTINIIKNTWESIK